MSEFYTLLFVAWVVYLSETIWWVRERQVVLTGKTIGGFRAHYGPALLVTRDQGTFCPRFIPPFTCSFDLDTAGTRRAPVSADRARAVETARSAIEASARVRSIGELIWAYVFVGIPVIIAVFGFLRTWLLLAALLVALFVIALAAYRSAWRELHPAEPRGWRSHGFLMAISPLGVIRAADRLTRHALAEFAPMTAMTLLATREDAIRVARLAYFDGAGRDRPATFSREECTLIAPLLAADLFAPPERENAQMSGYCPRCHAQLTRATGPCPDCQTVGILRFATNG